ncbi:MAG TPA: hypothetical protein ENN99_01415, partial [Chloroflexi bacterium]|nr:hypothetical protein [Chloroflexota bacterium]
MVSKRNPPMRMNHISAHSSKTSMNDRATWQSGKFARLVLPMVLTWAIAATVCSLVAPPMPVQAAPPDPRFGAVEAYNDSPAAVEAGVAWDRLLFQWRDLQPNGPHEWYDGDHAAIVAQAAVAGREVIGLLIRTPAWATDDIPDCGVPRGLYLPVDEPDNLWANYVRRVVGAYAGHVDRWIVWNEPDIAMGTYGVEWCGTIENYYQLLKVAYLAAHQANPNVKIHLAALTFWHDRTYLRRFLDVATQDPGAAEHGYYFDVVSLHIYFQTESVPYIINETRAALSAYGLQKPVWVNETNAASNSDPPYWELPGANFQISLDEQAGFLLQSFALALASGAERVAVYRWVDHAFTDGVEPKGLIRLDGSYRPAIEAYRLITTHYVGAITAREDRQASHTVVTLDRGNLVTRVMWARTPTAAAVSVPALNTQARLIDQTGVEQTVEPVGGLYTFSLPGARCADSRGCIIGGTTYLLIEETGATPSPAESPTPPPAGEDDEALTPIAEFTPTLTTTLTISPVVATETPLPTDTPEPTVTSTLTPTATATPPPT